MRTRSDNIWTGSFFAKKYLTTDLFSYILTDVKKIPLQVVLDMEMDNIVELSLLYDFYGALLKEHKREIFEDYILNDYSLSEIAVEKGMTRQGVYDIIKRSSKELRLYEEKLSLVHKFQKTKEMVNQIQTLSKNLEGYHEDVETIQHLTTKILDEL